MIEIELDNPFLMMVVVLIVIMIVTCCISFDDSGIKKRGEVKDE